MRTLALMALAPALALTGSIAKADFNFTQSRVSGFPTDTVTFFLQMTPSGSTAGFPFVSGINMALFDATNPSGLIVASNSVGKVNGYIGAGSHFFTNIADPAGSVTTLITLQGNPNVLNPDGSITASGAQGSTPYAANATFGVQGLGGAIGDATGQGIDMSSGPIPIAQAVVFHNDWVVLLQTAPTGDLPGNRVIFPTFQTSGTDILVTTGTGVNKLVGPLTESPLPAVPEPTALGWLALASFGLLSRHRQCA